MSEDALARLGLRAAAEGIPASNPDAALLADLAAAADMKENSEAAFRRWNGPAHKRDCTAKEARAAYYLIADALDDIEKRITATPARTEAGAAEKLQYALSRFAFLGGGSLFRVPYSAMRDALAVVFACPPPMVKPPRKTRRKKSN